MTQEEKKEFKEMKEWFDQVKTGGKLLKWGFSALLAVGGAYLMIKQILHT